MKQRVKANIQSTIEDFSQGYYYNEAEKDIEGWMEECEDEKENKT